jgi:hypothetical protein
MQRLGLWTATDYAQSADAPYVRIAQLDVDPQRLAEFKTVLEQSVSTSVRVEPGVYALYAVALKAHRTGFSSSRCTRTRRHMPPTARHPISACFSKPRRPW